MGKQGDLWKANSYTAIYTRSHNMDRTIYAKETFVNIFLIPVVNVKAIKMEVALYKLN